MKRYILQDYGPDVQWAVDKIQALVALDGESATLFTPEERQKLRSLAARCETTEYWEEHAGYLPQKGELIVYIDHDTYEEEGVVKNIPGIKIGTGNAYVADLVFIDQKISDTLADHINNSVMHTTQEEKDFWNNKINIQNVHEVEDETLIFDRQ